MTHLKIRRALLTVSDKSQVVELGRALADAGAELVATGKTAKVLEEAGLKVVPIEKVSGSPEAFKGRMKTLSFPVCSGILYRRGDADDERDLKTLGIQPIDCVVVNFYPFEAAVAKPGITRPELIEEVDIGGPTLVRAAAKNAPAVLVLTDPTQYSEAIEELRGVGGISPDLSLRCAAEAWTRIEAYDVAIAAKLGEASGTALKRTLRYGENPHQTASLEFHPDSPIDWDSKLTPTEISYNNILDVSAAYALASDLRTIDPSMTGVVVVKHNNPCGVAMISKSAGSSRGSKLQGSAGSSASQGSSDATGASVSSGSSAQMTALLRAWEGDPVSAFGSVLVFTDPLEADSAAWLSERFVELIAAPGLTPGHEALKAILVRRKKLKALGIRRFGEQPQETQVSVPGGILRQTSDTGNDEEFRSVTRVPWPKEREKLARFAVSVSRSLKSNALALVRELPNGFQLVGAGQGQPNRVEALEKLLIPRARAVLEVSGGKMEECILASDAFFPFRDTVDLAYQGGIRFIIQPGGSIKDAESIQACDEHGIAMALTGVRHFRH